MDKDLPAAENVLPKRFVGQAVATGIIMHIAFLLERSDNLSGITGQSCFVMVCAAKGVASAAGILFVFV